MSKSEVEHYLALIGDFVSDGTARRDDAMRVVNAIADIVKAQYRDGLAIQRSDVAVRIFVGKYTFGLKVENRKPVLYRLTMDAFREQICDMQAIALDLSFDGSTWRSTKPSTYITPVPGEPTRYQPAEAVILEAIFRDISENASPPE